VKAIRVSEGIIPLGEFKAQASRLIRELKEEAAPLVITQNGKATAVIQDVASFEETQETLALLKILALGNRQIEAGKTVAAGDVIRRLRGRAARKAGS
jgi:prevent-host-death family protein